ncbi:MAG TPA: CorA family divalent cation transporter [Candidatus Limnocylindrales bacterium]|jgi:Mg2+ and Co2+ transporter CorA
MTHKVVALVGRLYDSNAQDREVDIESGMAMPSGSQLLWIDMDRDAAQLSRVANALGLTGALEPLAEPRPQPRLLQAKDYVRLSVIGLAAGAQDPPRPVAVDLLAVTNVVVSVHDREIEGLGVPLEVVKGETQFGALDEAAFVAVLLDAILAGYFRAVEGIERRIDEYDARALVARPDDNLIGDLVGLRREVAILRRALSPQREVFYTLERPGLVLGDSESAAWPQIADRFRQAVEAVENARELLVGTFDIVISRQGERTNDVMRVLTVISSVLLPAVVIAGVMGMNFKPSFFDDPQNFLIVIVAMFVLATGILLFARFKRWL